jgi:hypothetical protein
MSMAALSLVLLHVLTIGMAPQADEGIEAHLFQLLIALQVPILIYYAVRWLPRDPKAALSVMGAQLVAAVCALTPIYLLKW